MNEFAHVLLIVGALRLSDALFYPAFSRTQFAITGGLFIVVGFVIKAMLA